LLKAPLKKVFDRKVERENNKIKRQKTIVDFSEKAGGLMEFIDIVVFMKEYGVIVFIFLLSLGMIGLIIPISNELIVMTAGYFATFLSQNDLLLWFLTWIGMTIGTLVNYSIGRWIGASHLLKWKTLREKLSLERGQNFIERYKKSAFPISVFIPFIRHLIPYVAGTGKSPFFLFFSLTTLGNLVWTSLFFAAGTYFHKYISIMEKTVTSYGLLCFILIFVLLMVIRKWTIRNKQKARMKG
jgi:membrane-associated protein